MNGVEAIATNLGLLAFSFKESSLGGFRRLDFRGIGEVPEVVMGNNEAIVSLQIDRLRMAVFVTACIYGVHSKRNHIALDRPLFPGLDEIYNWVEVPDHGVLLPEFDSNRLRDRLGPRVAELKKRQFVLSSISVDDLTEGLAFADRLLRATPTYTAVDPMAMIVMTYQAMILHGRQHASASIALAAVVVESALEELMFASGLVSGVAKRLDYTAPANRTGPATPISRRRLKELGFNGTINTLKTAGVLNDYLVQRVENLRQTRNALMHGGADAVPKQSGEALTAVRDILWLCTGECGFQLIVG
ncbi:hypothetical protein NKJ35_19210 [Mesorhizobium sp. M0136]|uniref:hypothetical protein n=1 Tax=Mesorhizobium sp. M0136 TaxID=2956890 RepID=UPI003338DFA3